MQQRGGNIASDKKQDEFQGTMPPGRNKTRDGDLTDNKAIDGSGSCTASPGINPKTVSSTLKRKRGGKKKKKKKNVD